MAKVELKSARTTETDPSRAASALSEALGPQAPKMATLFASSDRDPIALNRAMRGAFHPKSRLRGVPETCIATSITTSK